MALARCRYLEYELGHMHPDWAGERLAEGVGSLNCDSERGLLIDDADCECRLGSDAPG